MFFVGQHILCFSFLLMSFALFRASVLEYHFLHFSCQCVFRTCWGRSNFCICFSQQKVQAHVALLCGYITFLLCNTCSSSIIFFTLVLFTTMSPSKAAQAPPPAPPPLHAGPLPAEGPPPVAPPALKAMPAGPAPLPPPTSPAPHNLTSKSAPAAPPHPKPERFVIWIGQKHSTIQSEAGLRKAFAPFTPYEFHSRFESGGFCLVKTSSLLTAWRIFAFGKKAGLDLGKHPGPQIETVKDTKIAPPLAPNEMNQIWAEVSPGVSFESL